MSRPARRLSLLTLICLAVGGLLGGMFGGKVLADPQRPDDALWRFGRIVALIEDQYVGPVDSKELIEDAVDGMLQRLDPHSNFLDAESFKEMRDEQRGKFSGLGIQITKRGADKPLTIIAPIDGTPADRAGLISGDIIAKIEGQPTIELSVQDAVRLLKGEKGTEVTITIERPGTREPFDVTIERDDIPIESIRVTFMVNEDVGYIRISNFTSTTADELDQAIQDLRDRGMDKLLLDLRGNPGGLLDQAVQVTERFIPADRLIVYTRGRIHGSDQDYVAKRGVERVEFPLVLLVDESSASASEIVSGAIQDHDRGLVVGEPTFGKGLVQRVIPLQSGGALAVTTAKYYTPSGRLIQRDYADLEEYYLNRDDVGEMPPMENDDAEREVFYTASGRKVYGGGGIRPDYVVESEPAPGILLGLLRENLLFDFSVEYVNSHPDLAPGFDVGDEVVDDFRRFLGQREFDLDEQEFADNRETIRLRLEAQIARVKWDQVAEAKVLVGGDPQVQRALGLFDEAADLASHGDEGEPGRRAAKLSAEALSAIEGSSR